MTAIALKSLAREPRIQAPHKREPATKREFANLVEKERKPTAKETTKRLLEDNGPAEKDALAALLMNIPPAEMPQGGIPEAIATEISMVIDVPEMPKAAETNVALAASIADLLPKLAVQPQGTRDLIPMPIEDEISDGVPVAIDVGNRPRPKKFVDEEAITMAVPIPPAMRQLMHAPTEIALPIVDGTKPKAITQIIPDAVPVLPALVAKLAPAPMQFGVPEIPMTPLEQAVQDLILEIDDRDDKTSSAPAISAMIPEVQLLSIEHADAPAPVAPLREPRLMPEQANPSHVHLVIDDGAERVVVTVAVRGSEVNVALRGQDDATTAALARNAGTLDHAMRARGLDLASLMTGRDDTPKQDRPDREQRERDRNGKQTFSLEELA